MSSDASVAALKRDAKTAAISSLNVLATAYAADDGIKYRIQQMLQQLSSFPTGEEDVKPIIVPRGNMIVIGEAVLHNSGRGESSAPASNAQRKRPRRAATTEASAPLLADCPVGECEVLLHRKDGTRQWTEWCTVAGHSGGQLVVHVPDEDDCLLSLHSRDAATVRRIERAAAGASASAAGSSSLAAAHAADDGGHDGGHGDAMEEEEEEEEEEAEKNAVVDDEGGGASAAALTVPESSQLSACEQLASTELRTSAGRTRERLNSHLRTLGLHAVFGQPVVSRKGPGPVSHLTFNIEQWNDLPADPTCPFQWWLGEGEVRLQLANLINPEQHSQPEGGVPVFFAHKRKKGGALCHYGGHFTTRSFKRLPEAQVFKGLKRQARIELAFHHFDVKLGAAIDAIPE